MWRFIICLHVFVVALSYGQSNYCSITSEHTLCKFARGSINQATCGTPTARGVNTAEQKEILQVHNKYRSKVANGQEKRPAGTSGQPSASNMRELEWDNELAAVAQAWADQCTFRHDCSNCRDTSRFKVGQNLYMYGTTVGGGSSRWGDAVKSWYDEVDFFNPGGVGKYSFKHKTGHYTAVVWADTYKVGCGYIKYKPDRFYRGFYVCNYGPAGNWIGSPMYKVGRPCTACPQNTSCSKSFPGLCAGN